MSRSHQEQRIENDEKNHAFVQQAAVVFSGRADLWWLKFLKPGFRHCFLVLRDGGHWVVMNPLSHRTEIQVPPVDGEFDLCRWLEDQGFTVARTRVFDVDGGSPPRPAPWMPFSCVEAIKRVLGIRSRRVVTPWGLYRYLTVTVGRKRRNDPPDLKKTLRVNFSLDSAGNIRYIIPLLKTTAAPVFPVSGEAGVFHFPFPISQSQAAFMSRRLASVLWSGALSRRLVFFRQAREGVSPMASLISAFIAPAKPSPPPPPPPPPPRPVKAESEEEQKARTRRSRRATIATTSRGALKLGNLAPQRKRLLGE